MWQAIKALIAIVPVLKGITKAIKDGIAYLKELAMKKAETESQDRKEENVGQAHDEQNEKEKPIEDQSDEAIKDSMRKDHTKD